MEKKYYCHSIWCGDSNEWIEANQEEFNEEVVDHIDLFTAKYSFEKGKMIHYFNFKGNSYYDWKVVITL